MRDETITEPIKILVIKDTLQPTQLVDLLSWKCLSSGLAVMASIGLHAVLLLTISAIVLRVGLGCPLGWKSLDRAHAPPDLLDLGTILNGVIFGLAIQDATE